VQEACKQALHAEKAAHRDAAAAWSRREQVGQVELATLRLSSTNVVRLLCSGCWPSRRLGELTL